MENLDKEIKKIKNGLANFFAIDFLDINKIKLLESRKDIDNIKKEKTESWLVSFVKDKTIFILHPDVIEKESSHKRSDFLGILKHEYSHIYYEQLSHGEDFPIWLSEGLANFLSGYKDRKPTLKEALRLDYYFNNADPSVYPVGLFWVTYLINTYGKESVIDLIRSFRHFKRNLQISDFKKKFHKIYNLTENDLERIAREKLK